MNQTRAIHDLSPPGRSTTRSPGFSQAGLKLVQLFICLICGLALCWLGLAGARASAGEIYYLQSSGYAQYNSPPALLPDPAASPSITLQAVSSEMHPIPGLFARFSFSLTHHLGITSSFSLCATSPLTWTSHLPASLPSVPDGTWRAFSLTVDLPASADCPIYVPFTITATAAASPHPTATQTVNVRSLCGVGGRILDRDTQQPLARAYVWMQNTPDGLNKYFDAFTNNFGEFGLYNASQGVYYLGASARYHQTNFYPSTWPTGAITLTYNLKTLLPDISLVASHLAYSPGSFSATLTLGDQITYPLALRNLGSGPLRFAVTPLEPLTNSLSASTSLLTAAQPTPTPAPAERIDPRLRAELQAAPTADVLILLNDQADLSAAEQITDWEARGRYVYETLSQHAARSQAPLRSQLDQKGIAYTPLYIINAILAHDADLPLANEVAARSDVAQLLPNQAYPVEDTRPPEIFLPDYNPQPATPRPAAPSTPQTVEWNIHRVRADQVWASDQVTGSGIIVANIDTGVAYNHPALYRQYLGWDGSTMDHNYHWYDPYHQGPQGGRIPNDNSSHGTHVMGTMVGATADGVNQIGMAPGARWIACDATDDNSGYLLTEQTLICAQWVLAPWDLDGKNPDPARRPHIVNNSWGGGQGDYWFSGVIAAWQAAGIFSTFSNGNKGSNCSTAGSPGDNSNAFSVGNLDSSNTINTGSSRGPAVFSGVLKPNLSAPGTYIRSSIPGGGYGMKGGTSMAAPHAAGAVALLWSAHPELIGQVERTKLLLQRSAQPLYSTQSCGGNTSTSHPNNVYGWGLLDAKAAIDAAQAGAYQPSWLHATPISGEIAPGKSLTVSLQISAPLASLRAPQTVYTATLWLTAQDPYYPSLRLPVTLTLNSTPSPVYLPLVARQKQE